MHPVVVLTDVEADWLAYAREVVTDEDHRAACSRIGGSPSHPGVDATDLRWPGYLGADFGRGAGVLVVSNIHRNFASGAITLEHRDLLVETTRAWRDGHADDDAYLAATRTVYLAGLRGWTVGKHIKYVIDALGLDLAQIAYLNAARCQFPETPPHLPAAARTKPALQRLCLRRFPLQPLVQSLQPRLLLFTSVEAFDAAQAMGESLEAPQVLMHQLNGRLLRPLPLGADTVPAPMPRSTWVPALVDHVQAGRSHTRQRGA